VVEVRRVSFSWHPAYWTALLGVLMVVTGFGLLLLGWRGAAATLLVPIQVPYAASGGLAGLGLIGVGALLVNLQVSRHLAARERARTRLVARAATALLVDARRR
jgi:hypothetical protein